MCGKLLLFFYIFLDVRQITFIFLDVRQITLYMLLFLLILNMQQSTFEILL
jgi:hypothetical protein